MRTFIDGVHIEETASWGVIVSSKKAFCMSYLHSIHSCVILCSAVFVFISTPIYFLYRACPPSKLQSPTYCYTLECCRCSLFFPTPILLTSSASALLCFPEDSYGTPCTSSISPLPDRITYTIDTVLPYSVQTDGGPQCTCFMPPVLY